MTDLWRRIGRSCVICSPKKRWSEDDKRSVMLVLIAAACSCGETDVETPISADVDGQYNLFAEV